MTYTIDFSKDMALTLEPENDVQETIQSIYILVNTALGEVPCYRDFGIDSSYLHKPIQMAQAMYAAAITSAFEKFIDNVTIDEIKFTNDSNDPSVLYPILEVTIEDE